MSRPTTKSRRPRKSAESTPPEPGEAHDFIIRHGPLKALDDMRKALYRLEGLLAALEAQVDGIHTGHTFIPDLSYKANQSLQTALWPAVVLAGLAREAAEALQQKAEDAEGDAEDLARAYHEALHPEAAARMKRAIKAARAEHARREREAVKAQKAA